MKTPIKKILLEKGLVEGTVEWRKEYNRIRYQTRNPAYRERRRTARLAKNLTPEQLEMYRARWREKAARKRAKIDGNLEGREYYARNKERIREQINARRKSKDPARGLKKLIDSFRRGDIGYDEFIRCLNAAVIQSHALSDGGV